MLAFMCPRSPARSCTAMRMAANLLSTSRSAVHRTLLAQQDMKGYELRSMAVSITTRCCGAVKRPLPACASLECMCQPGVPWSVHVPCSAVHPVLPVRPTELSAVICAWPQGYAVGNGVTDEEMDGNAVIPFAYGQSLLSHEQYQRVHRECQGSFWNATQGKQDLASSFLHLYRMFCGVWGLHLQVAGSGAC